MHLLAVFVVVEDTAVIDLGPGDSGRCSTENLTVEEGDGGDGGVERWPYDEDCMITGEALGAKDDTDEEAKCEYDEVSDLEERKAIVIVEGF